MDIAAEHTRFKQLPVRCKWTSCYAHIAAVSAAIQDAQLSTLALSAKHAYWGNGLGQLSIKTKENYMPRSGLAGAIPTLSPIRLHRMHTGHFPFI